jgi:hypothetical protein
LSQVVRVAVVFAIAVATVVLPASARPVAGQGSANVVVIPGFDAPVYPGFKGVPRFPTGAAELSKYRFSQLADEEVTTAALQPYDTIVLYGVRWAALSIRTQAAINLFAHTGKVLIWDADATGSQNYSSFIHPFSTSAGGEVATRKHGLVVSFPSGQNPLASSDPASSAYLDPSALLASNHLVEDMSVMNPGAANWTPSLTAANATLPSGGWLVARGYGSTSDRTGAVVYSGMDADAFSDRGSPNYALKELALELALPFLRSPASCSPGCSGLPGGGGSPSGIGGAGSPTFATCSIGFAPKNWVRGTISYSLKLAIAEGIRGEIRTTSGKLVGSVVQGSPSTTLNLRLNTKRLPTNRVSALDLVIYVNQAKACTLPTTIKVDNTTPRLLSKRLRREGSGWRVTGKPSEAVTFSIWSHGRLLRLVKLNRARFVSLLVARTPVPTAIVVRDRAGNARFVSLSS